MTRHTRRRCRRTRWCSHCHARILPGEIYVEAWASPDHEGLGNLGWWRLDCCAACAPRYGLADLVAEDLAVTP